MPWTWQYNPITDDGDEVWVDEPQQPNPQDGYDETEWLCSELASSEDGRKKMVAAIGAENLAALGYVTWRPASEKPGEPGVYPVLGPDNFKTLDRWDGQEWVSGITVYWLPLPALPGKGEK